MNRLLEVTRRIDVSNRRAGLAKGGALLVSLLLGGLLLAFTGRSPLELATTALSSTFGQVKGLEEVLVVATPITLLALAVGTGFAGRVWNVGAEGQFYLGAWAAAGVGIHWSEPSWLVLLAMMVAAALAGAAWALLPGALRAYYGVNEIISTLLMNFIAIQWVTWFATEIWADPQATVLSASYRIETEVPLLFGSPRLHAGVFLPLIVAAIVGWALHSTRWGYEVRMVGSGPAGANYAGMPVKARIVSVMVLSGAIAGVGGMIQMTGTSHRLSASLSNQYGLSGLMIAALAGLSVVAVIVFGFLIGILFRAGLTLQAQGLTTNIIFSVYGLILASMAVGEVVSRYRFRIPFLRPTTGDMPSSGSDP